MADVVAITTTRQRTRRGHYKLTPELIEKIRKLIPSGAPNKTIAKACGISYEAWITWANSAKSGNGSELENAFLQAIREGEADGELTNLMKIHEGDSRDAQWILTHSPKWRDSWSDAAATRREVQRHMSFVVDAIESAASLTAEQRQEILLQLQARGLGAVRDADG